MAAIGGIRGQQHWLSVEHVDRVGRDAIRVTLEGGELTAHQIARRIGYGAHQIRTWLEAMPEVEPIDADADDQDRLYRLTRPCNCVCTIGGFCGGCGHAGCGRRR